MTSPQHRPPHLRLVQTGAQPASRVARRVGEGVLDAMPAGLEVTESINGVVSVRRADPARPRAPLGDMEIVREEVGRHPHLQRYVVDGRDGEIIINEPVGGLGEEQVRVLATVMGIASPRLREATIPTPAAVQAGDEVRPGASLSRRLRRVPDDVPRTWGMAHPDGRSARRAGQALRRAHRQGVLLRAAVGKRCLSSRGRPLGCSGRADSDAPCTRRTAGGRPLHAASGLEQSVSVLLHVGCTGSNQRVDELAGPGEGGRLVGRDHHWHWQVDGPVHWPWQDTRDDADRCAPGSGLPIDLDFELRDVWKSAHILVGDLVEGSVERIEEQGFTVVPSRGRSLVKSRLRVTQGEEDRRGRRARGRQQHTPRSFGLSGLKKQTSGDQSVLRSKLRGGAGEQ